MRLTQHYLKPQRRSTSNELKLGQCCVCRFTFFHLLSLARQTHIKFRRCSASDFRSINFLNKKQSKISLERVKEKEEIESENSINLEWVFSWIFLFLTRLHAVRIVFNSLFKMKSKSRTFFIIIWGDESVKRRRLMGFYFINEFGLMWNFAKLFMFFYLVDFWEWNLSENFTLMQFI